MSRKLADFSLLEKLARRALYYSTQMIHQANDRPDAEKGDPKVGGHPAAAASSTHILGALHLLVRRPQDFLAIKPHASPMDHAYSHLLGLFAHPDGSEFSEEEAKRVMFNLRKFVNPDDPAAEPAFQSYHAVWDPDSFNYFPSGTVGIPPVVAAYTALAYRFARHHGFDVPEDAHFWCLIGDSEFREGSLAECMPDAAERGLGSVTWIIDYNRQNLDGTRVINEEGIGGTDAHRIEHMARANGWRVIQVRHGSRREALFKKVGSELRRVVESLSDFELQALLFKRDAKITRKRLIELAPQLKAKLTKVPDRDMLEFLLDLGGHDLATMSEALESCRGSKHPTLVIAHTIKGWGISSLAAATGNHSTLPPDEEVDAMRGHEKIPDDDPFQLFGPRTPEGRYLAERGSRLRAGRKAQQDLRDRNLARLGAAVESAGGFPDGFAVNLKMAPWANTQWMWGQLAAKLVRIVNTSGATLTSDESRWGVAAHYVVTMAPDVGTSTNLNPSMDGKIYGPETGEDFERRYDVKDTRRPDLLPLEKETHRHLRFEIEEANTMSCLGAFGKMREHVGVPFLPMMTVYDFFIKRALDQFFYNLYWKSGFILVGTPSGVTLSPEGAQHSWKSDFQIPNGVTWEPAFALEMDWILADAVRRHFTGDNAGREGVLIRAVTRGIEQKTMIESLRRQVRFNGVADGDILEATRQDALRGGYWLLNYSGFDGYAPGDNVVHLLAMGALAPEALRASEKLLSEGIFANVLLVTSPDLLLGTLARDTGYKHLRENLGVTADLFLNRTESVPVGRVEFREGDGNGRKLEIPTVADLYSLRGSRIPIVGVCDGEPGLLDNAGSIVGVPQDTLAVRKHSKSGRPADVYRYHHVDPESIAEAAIRMLEQAASEEILVPKGVLETVSGESAGPAEPESEPASAPDSERY